MNNEINSDPSFLAASYSSNLHYIFTNLFFSLYPLTIFFLIKKRIKIFLFQKKGMEIVFLTFSETFFSFILKFSHLF